MLIDCGSCAGRGPACHGCLVSALFDAPEELAGLTAAEHRAIEVFARAGFDVEVLEVVDTPVASPAPAAPRRAAGRARRPRHVA